MSSEVMSFLRMDRKWARAWALGLWGGGGGGGPTWVFLIKIQPFSGGWFPFDVLLKLA